MNEQQKRLVRSAWARITRDGDALQRSFYERLFELDPSLDARLRPDMEAQGRNLVTMIDLAVASLDDAARLGAALESLCRRQFACGVLDSHYEAVGSSLLWALEKALGEELAPEAREAWVMVYVMLAGTMREREDVKAVASN